MNRFGFTGNIHESVFSKISRFTVIEKILNEFLVFSKYSHELQGIVFVYIALKPDFNYTVADFSKFRRKNKIIEIGINLDYNQLIQADDENTLELLSETYLIGIEKYLTGKKDFDGNKFYTDVKQLFTENGILKNGNRVER